MKYRVKWKSKINPKHCGHGSWIDNRQLVQSWVDHCNKHYPSIHHELEGQKPDNSLIDKLIDGEKPPENQGILQKIKERNKLNNQKK